MQYSTSARPSQYAAAKRGPCAAACALLYSRKGDERMKRFYILCGPMGVGKSATGTALRDRLPDCAFLDGDWCWDMHPFTVCEETKDMVMKNITFLLNNFLSCSVIDNIVFCWVMHEQQIIDDIISKLCAENAKIFKISLVCSPEALEKRLKKDIENGVRNIDIIERSIKRIPLYNKLDTVKINVSDISAETAAGIISKLQ